VPGLGFWDRLGFRRVLGAARRFPALFFIFVLGGEDPIGPRPLPGDRHRQNFR